MPTEDVEVLLEVESFNSCNGSRGGSRVFISATIIIYAIIVKEVVASIIM